MKKRTKRSLWLLEEAKRTLAKWMAAEKLTPIGPVELANYDPPFTPAFLRRNEVLVRIQSE